MNLHQFDLLKGPATISYNQVHTIIFFPILLEEKNKIQSNSNLE